LAMPSEVQDQFDDAVVGAGIIGLAHAYQLARRGRKVLVLERGVKAVGASVRNFGMIWPIGQPSGAPYALARRSAEIWRDVLADAHLWNAPSGSLHLAYQEDEAQVLREFAETAEANGFRGVSLLTPEAAERLSPALQPRGLQAALYSESEINVDPRQVVAELPGYLERTFGVQFAFDTAAIGYDRPTLQTSRGHYLADNLLVCSGIDLQTLYPEILTNAGIIPCKLQMLRAACPASDWKLGPMLAAGLTLQHYTAFENCPTLPRLKERFAEEMPEYNRWGIHVLVSQNSEGDLSLGDSHEYGNEAVEPFNSDKIDALILAYLDTFLQLPTERRIIARWNGIYGKLPGQPYFTAQPEPGVFLATATGGAGMTLSFGLAEQNVSSILEIH
jgi:FAD dependent oxidoreductase TIGR03364